MATPLRATANRSADLVVIGGGAGGLAAARAAARRGATVTLVQLGPLGGDCTFTGCVASKALIDAAHRREPFERAIAATRRAVKVIAATETDDVLAREGVEVVHGWAELRAPDSSTSTGRRSAAPGSSSPPVPDPPCRRSRGSPTPTT